MARTIASLLFGISCILALYAWRHLDEDSRFPVAWGVPPSVQGTVSKRTGLILFVAIEAALLAGTLVAAPKQPAVGWIGVGLMLFQLLAEIRVVRRLSGRTHRRAI